MIWIHLSELSVDRLIAGELSSGDAEAMRDHAADCARCGALLDDAIAVQRTFVAEPLRFVTPLRPRPDQIDRASASAPMRDSARPRAPTGAAPRPFADCPPRVMPTAAAIGAGLALAAGLAVALTWPRANADGSVRTKGAAIVGFFVEHDGQIRRGAPHETVRPGDRVELFTTAPAPMWFAAIGDDPRGTRTIYVPPQRIEPGREQLLPVATELDDTLGTEVVTGVFCDAAFDVHALELAALPPGCAIDRFTLVVVAR